MRKKISIILCIVLSLTLVSCKPEREKVSSSKLNTELPSKEIVDNSVVLTEEFQKSIIDCISQYTYVDSTQNMYSYSVDGTTRESVAKSKISIDIKNQISFISLEVSYQDGSSTLYTFANDNKNSINICKINDGEYIENKNQDTYLSIDYNKVTNVYSFIEEQTKGVLPAIGTKGVIENNDYIFSIERDAIISDVSGADYDKLGTTTIKMIVSKDYKIKEISMDTTFFIGQKEYGVSTICTYDNYSTNELDFPSYNKE